MRAIHDARDKHPGMLLEPSDLGPIDNLAEKLNKLDGMDLVKLSFADGKIRTLSLTKQGLVFFETASDERWRFIRRSILVPIGVSIVTTGLLWLIKFLITGTWL